MSHPLPGELRHTADLRREVAAREAALYGALLEDVRLLRGRGFVVTAHGNRYRVGNRFMGAHGLAAVAERERRLLHRKTGGF